MAVPDDAVFVIGLGQVGSRLAGALRGAGVRVGAVTREQGWEEALAPSAALRLVCVREEDLDPVAARLEAVPAERLVFVQNGWVRPLLERFPACTRGLCWFTSKGGFFRVLRPSPLSGPGAPFLAGALAAGGIAAAAVADGDFRGLEADKMGFNCVVGLPLAVHGVSLGRYLAERAAEAEAVFREAVTVCAAALGVPPRAEERWAAFLAAAAPLEWVTSSTATALDFRNAAVVRLARRHALAAPANESLLAAAGHRI